MQLFVSMSMLLLSKRFHSKVNNSFKQIVSFYFNHHLVTKHLLALNSNQIYSQRFSLNSTTIIPKMRFFKNTMPDFVSEEHDDLFCDQIKHRILEWAALIWENESETQDDDCPYVGKSGVAYMFWYMSLQSWLFNGEQTNDYLKKATHLINIASNYRSSGRHRKELPFLLGHAGTHVISSLIFNSAKDTNKTDIHSSQYARLANTCLEVDYLPNGCDELLVGRAGYLSGAFMVNKHVGNNIISKQTMIDLGIAIINSGMKYSREHNSESPLMFSYHNTEYLGAAHGLAGILQALLQIDGIFQANQHYESLIKNSVDYMLSLQTHEGNFPSSTDESKARRRREADEELIHFCHGAPGVFMLMARAYLIWKEDKYLESCLKCGELIWEKGLLLKGPGICHGVAGNGYVFLMLYKLTGHQKHLHRAKQFAKFIFTPEFKKARQPDAPLSLYEGWSGTICYLIDCLRPEQVNFPLYFDIFA